MASRGFARPGQGLRVVGVAGALLLSLSLPCHAAGIYRCTPLDARESIGGKLEATDTAEETAISFTPLVVDTDKGRIHAGPDAAPLDIYRVRQKAEAGRDFVATTKVPGNMIVLRPWVTPVQFAVVNSQVLAITGTCELVK